VRPAHLAGDAASTEGVLRHAVEWLDSHQDPPCDIVVYLQVTDPFRRQGIVDRVVRALLENPQVDSVLAAKPEHKNYWIEENGGFRSLGRHSYLPRQSKPPVYREDTGIALATRASFIKEGRRLGDRVHIIPHECQGDFIDIHSESDLRLANLLVEHFKVLPNEQR
jgi:CMP-N,N'-diacetyllegionaminic acid synthase